MCCVSVNEWDCRGFFISAAVPLAVLLYGDFYGSGEFVVGGDGDDRRAGLFAGDEALGAHCSDLLLLVDHLSLLLAVPTGSNVAVSWSLSLRPMVLGLAWLRCQL